MVNHHPKLELLKAYVDGTLPASVAVIIAAHIELCEECQDLVKTLSKESALVHFASESDVSEHASHPCMSATQDEFDDLIDRITSDSSVDETALVLPQEVKVEGDSYILPRVLSNLDHTSWVNIGKLSRSRIELEDGSLHTSLLHIAPEGGVPQHTHKGFEITLLLEGSFEDELGKYNKGDFIWLDGDNTHEPVSKEGCLCLTVSSDAQHFTQGLSKLLNPIGRFIY